MWRDKKREMEMDIKMKIQNGKNKGMICHCDHVRAY